MDKSQVDTLSSRERQVLELAATGLIDKEIGDALGISLNTLRTYWTRIRLKLGEVSRPALAAALVEEEARLAATRSDRLLAEDWELDLKSNLIVASDSINREYGLAPGVAHRRETYQQFYHPEDRDMALAAWRSIEESSEDLHHITYRRILPSGIRLVSIFVRIIRDVDGRPVKLRGHRVSNRDFRQDHNPEVRIGLWRRDAMTGEIWADRECIAILGLERGDRLSEDDFYASVEPEFQALAHSFVQDARECQQDSVSADLRVRASDGLARWIRVEARLEYEEDVAVRISGVILAFE